MKKSVNISRSLPVSYYWYLLILSVSFHGSVHVNMNKNPKILIFGHKMSIFVSKKCPKFHSLVKNSQNSQNFQNSHFWIWIPITGSFYFDPKTGVFRWNLLWFYCEFQKLLWVSNFKNSLILWVSASFILLTARLDLKNSLILWVTTYDWIHQKLKKFGSVRNRYVEVGNMYTCRVRYIKTIVFHHGIVFFDFSNGYDHPLWHNIWVILIMS